jgi:hypothetical protein
MSRNTARCAFTLGLATAVIASHTPGAEALSSAHRAKCDVRDSRIRVVFSDPAWARRYIVTASEPKGWRLASRCERGSDGSALIPMTLRDVRAPAARDPKIFLRIGVTWPRDASIRLDRRRKQAAALLRGGPTEGPLGPVTARKQVVTETALDNGYLNHQNWKSYISCPDEDEPVVRQVRAWAESFGYLESPRHGQPWVYFYAMGSAFSVVGGCDGPATDPNIAKWENEDPQRHLADASLEASQSVRLSSERVGRRAKPKAGSKD